MKICFIRKLFLGIIKIRQGIVRLIIFPINKGSVSKYALENNQKVFEFIIKLLTATMGD